MSELTREQFEVLDYLCEEPEATIDSLSGKIRKMDDGVIAKTLSELLERGYIADGAVTEDGLSAMEPYRVKRAVFLAAGFGSRLVPVTLNTPKPLVRVHGKRIIDGLLDAVLAAGIEEIYLVRGYLAEQFDQLLYKYPMIQFMDTKVLVDQKHEFTLDAARIDIADREINVDENSGYREIEVVPNMANMEVKPEADWLKQTTPSWLDHLNELTIYWPSLPNGVNDRRGVVRLIGKSQKGEVLTEDSIVVYQSRGTEPPPTPTNDPSRWLIGTWLLQHNSYGYRLTLGEDGSYVCESLDRDGNVEIDHYPIENGVYDEEGIPMIDIGTYTITSYKEDIYPSGIKYITGDIHVDYVDHKGKSHSIDDDYTCREMYYDGVPRYELEYGFGGRHTRWFDKVK